MPFELLSSSLDLSSRLALCVVTRFSFRFWFWLRTHAVFEATAWPTLNAESFQCCVSNAELRLHNQALASWISFTEHTRKARSFA